MPGKYTTHEALDYQVRNLQRRFNELERGLETTNRNINSNRPAYLVIFSPGVPEGGVALGRISIPTAIRLRIDLGGSYAHAAVEATANTTLSIILETPPSAIRSTVGTILFPAGSNVGEFTFNTALVLSPGNVVEVENQSTADSTLADISITIAGER